MSENLISTENPRLKIQGLSKSFRKRVVLNNISFSVEAGERVGLLGHNGAGKTSLLRCIAGYWTGDSGQVLINGETVTPESIRTRRQIGYMPETVPLYGAMTVGEHLRMACELAGNQVSEPFLNRIEMRFGLPEVINREVRKISKGFRQRTGLALAMINFPDLLLLDEPTAALDPAQIVSVRELLNELKPEQSLIMSSHQLSEVHSICTRIIVIHHGQIVLDQPISDNIEELFLSVTST